MNPEIAFKTSGTFSNDGMKVDEIPFCRMADYRGQTQEYRLDLYKSEEAETCHLPVVIFVHGGGFIQPCDKRMSYIALFARILTKAGYAVAAPDYPLFDNEAHRDDAGGERAGYEKAAQAIHLARQYLVTHAEALGLDGERMFLMGGSAGSMAAFYAIALYPKDRYRAFINCWGAPDPVPVFSHFPPTLSIHGDVDDVVPYFREEKVQAGLAAGSVYHRLITLSGMGHTPLSELPVFMPEIMQWLQTYNNGLLSAD